MNENELIQTRVSIYLPYTILFGTFIYVLFYILDPGSPSPPFDEPINTVDCTEVDFSNFSNDAGRIHMTLTYRESIEFLPEYLPHFIHGDFISPLISYNFSGVNIENTTMDQSTINFTLYMPIAGEGEFHIHCGQKKIAQFKKNLTYINNWDQTFSTISYPYAKPWEFRLICYQNNQTAYFLNDIDKFNLNMMQKSFFNFSFYQCFYQHFREYHKTDEQKGTYVFLEDFNVHPWKQLLFNYNPLTEAVVGIDPTFVYITEPSALTKKLTKTYNNRGFEMLKNNTCYTKLIYPRAHANIEMKDEEYFEEAIRANFSNFRKKVKINPRIPNQIVTTEKFEQYAKETFPNATITKINFLTTVTEASSIASTATIFISDHISTLVHTVFMNNESLVIDLTPEEYSCNRWIDVYSRNVRANIFSYYNTTKCTCKKWECYPEFAMTTQNSINFTRITEVINDFLK